MQAHEAAAHRAARLPAPPPSSTVVPHASCLLRLAPPTRQSWRRTASARRLARRLARRPARRPARRLEVTALTHCQVRPARRLKVTALTHQVRPGHNHSSMVGLGATISALAGLNDPGPAIVAHRAQSTLRQTLRDCAVTAAQLR